MGGKRRAIVICHPDFDQPGRAGIREAQSFAKQYLEGQKQMIELAEQKGEDPITIAKIRQHTNKFLLVIRNLDKETL